jgi:hypothetical protein
MYLDGPVCGRRLRSSQLSLDICWKPGGGHSTVEHPRTISTTSWVTTPCAMSPLVSGSSKAQLARIAITLDAPAEPCIIDNEAVGGRGSNELRNFGTPPDQGGG